MVELVPPGGRRTEPLGSLAAEIETSRLVRGRVDAEAATGEADAAQADAAAAADNALADDVGAG